MASLFQLLLRSAFSPSPCHFRGPSSHLRRSCLVTKPVFPPPILSGRAFNFLKGYTPTAALPDHHARCARAPPVTSSPKFSVFFCTPTPRMAKPHLGDLPANFFSPFASPLFLISSVIRAGFMCIPLFSSRRHGQEFAALPLGCF